MRVSTAQFYFQNSQQLSNKQSNVNEQIGYISSGKRVLTAKDDAVSYGTLTGYKDELSNLDKYQRNLTQAENRNSLVETSFYNATNIMQELKQRFIQANNGTLSDLDLDALAALTEDSLDQMLDIANSKDETGGYIFSGYLIDVEPFSLQPDNSVIYQGDSGERDLQVAKNIFVQTNIAGDEAFEKVPNEIGDFEPVYNTNTSGVNVKSAVIQDPSLFDTDPTLVPININFTTATTVSITDNSGANLYPAGTFAPGQLITLTNGVELQIGGNPLPGDDIDLTPKENVSIFETIKSSIEWMRQGANPADPVLHAIEYDQILEQIDASLNYVVSNQTTAGARRQLADTQRSNHLDAELYLEKGRSNIEDLDFAKAVATFEQSQVALQAAQQTFVQIKDLSLFNYI